MTEENPSDQLQEGDAGASFSFAVEKVRDYAIFLIDKNGFILTWNRAAQVMKGYAPEEAIGNFFGMLYTDEQRHNKSPQHNLQMSAEHGTHQEETWRQKKDGTLFWAMVELIAIKSQAGELNGFCKITRDISVRKSLQDSLASEKERAQVTLSAIGDAVISIDAQGRIDFLNKKAEKLTGWVAAEALGRQFSEVVHIADESNGQSQVHQLTSALMQGEMFKANSRAILACKSGEHYAIEETAAPIHTPDGCPAGGVIVLRDVTKSRELQKRIAYQATHDALTRLVNRAEFEKRLQRAIGRKRDSQVAGAVLFMDLDKFKIVNDMCGHHAGDELLRQLSHLYSKEIRERDTLARLGGDEFGLIADHCTQEEAYLIAKKIQHATNDFQFIANGRSFRVGVSIGLAAFDETTASVEAVMRCADQACYMAKENGRNQIYRYMTSDAKIVERNPDVDWGCRLAEAMRSNHFQLHFQLIAPVDGNVGRQHYDVLLRLTDPDRGLLLPGNFLPAAERYGFMPKIDRWVVTKVVEWIGEHHARLDSIDFCLIHLSPKTLADSSFVPFVGGLLNHRKSLAAQMCFEISEENAVADMQQSLALVEGLQRLGCRVCIGGFGRGLASFTFLKQLPADFFKIDGSFISMIKESLFDEKMINLINELVHLMGKKTIAEWVEDQETAEVLSRIGIDYMQGHWIAHPKALGTNLHRVH